jgi:hypothetical protein
LARSWRWRAGFVTVSGRIREETGGIRGGGGSA